MTTSPQEKVVTTPVIHPATHLGHVHYTVADLERQVAFYRDILGFKLHWREGGSAVLGSGKQELLRLTENANARRVSRTTGLYHTAFLVPTRWDLAQMLRSIAETRTPIQGTSNHGTHFAIYLPDAEGNGIELAWDFPKDKWPKNFEEMLRNNRGLDPQEVFSALAENDAPWQGIHPDTQIGHVHLHVSHLDTTDHFYREILGFESPFDLTNAPREFTETAAFYSAGGYHHHIGTNIWQGEGAPPPPPDATGLRYYTILLPDQTALEQVIGRVHQAGIATEPFENGFLLHDPSHGQGLFISV
jgi:catechol 2,3-dioxygenase